MIPIRQFWRVADRHLCRGEAGRALTLVLEGRAWAGTDEAVVAGVEVVHAPGEGDDTIAAMARVHWLVMVVTADGELAERVRAAKAEVGGRWMLDKLVE